MSEEEKQIETKSERSGKQIKIFKAAFSIILAIFLLVLIVIKVNNPDFPFSAIIIYAVVASILILLIYFSTSLLKKYADMKSKVNAKEELPESVDSDIVRSMIKKKVEDPEMYQNHIRSWGEMNVHNINKNRIYVYKIELEYKDKRLGSNPTVVVNSHKPDKIMAFVPESAGHNHISATINNMSESPKDDPEVEETEMRNEFTGTVSKTKRVKPNKKENKAKKEEKADLE